MAGGPHAAVATCFECAGPAERVYEGVEDDQYVCAACGLRFGICFERDGPATAPLYPPTAEEAEAIRRLREEQGGA